jgi:hypothetical protein
MPELDYLVMADGIAPRADGKIDIYGAGWDTLFAPAVPTRHPQLAIALRVLISPQEAEHEHRLQLVLMGADAEIGRADATVQQVPPETRAAVPPGDMIGLGVILNLAGLIFPEYGRYHVAVLWDGNQLREPVRLRVAQPPQMGLPGLSGGPPLPR